MKVPERREQLLRMLRLAVRRVILQLRAERRQFGKGAWGGEHACVYAPRDEDNTNPNSKKYKSVVLVLPEACLHARCARRFCCWRCSARRHW